MEGKSMIDIDSEQIRGFPQKFSHNIDHVDCRYYVSLKYYKPSQPWWLTCMRSLNLHVHTISIKEQGLAEMKVKLIK